MRLMLPVFLHYGAAVARREACFLLRQFQFHFVNIIQVNDSYNFAHDYYT